MAAYQRWHKAAKNISKARAAQRTCLYATADDGRIAQTRLTIGRRVSNNNVRKNKANQNEWTEIDNQRTKSGVFART